MSELKNCPFCGGEATLVHGICELDNYVVCQKCLSKTKVFNTKESAIKTWNTRRPVERILERLEKEYDINNWGKPYGISLDKVIEIIKEEVGQIEEAHN